MTDASEMLSTDEAPTCCYLMFFRLQQCEEDKVTKDSQIRSLQEELTNQEDLVAKLQKEKKQLAQTRQKTDEDLQVSASWSLTHDLPELSVLLQASEDKANHLNRIKLKLEQNLDELEDTVEREKKVSCWKASDVDSQM